MKCQGSGQQAIGQAELVWSPDQHGLGLLAQSHQPVYPRQEEPQDCPEIMIGSLELHTHKSEQEKVTSYFVEFWIGDFKLSSLSLMEDVDDPNEVLTISGADTMDWSDAMTGPGSSPQGMLARSNCK